MPIAVDTTARSTSTTTSFTCTGTRLTLVVFAIFSDATLVTPTLTYNGTSMTFAGRERNTTGSNSVYAFYLIAPDTGAHNIVVSGGNGSFSAIFAASYTGTRQESQPDNETGTSDETFDTTLTKSITTNFDKSWVLFFPLLGTSRTLVAGTGSTARIVDANGSFSGYPCGIYDSNAEIDPAASYSMTVTCAAGTTQACHILLSIREFIIVTTTVTDTIAFAETPLLNLQTFISDTIAFAENLAIFKLVSVTVTDTIAFVENLNIVAPFHTLWTKFTATARSWTKKSSGN